MNTFEERNFIQPMGSAMMLSGCLGFFPCKFWVGGEVFLFKLYLGGEWTVQCPLDTGFSMQV